MGIYTEYLDRNMSFQELADERKRQLQRIQHLRTPEGGEPRDILVYAADLRKNDVPITINHEDLLPIADQLDHLRGKAVDVILETPGGMGEVTEDIVRLLRQKFEHVAFIVPGTAKSAGTIMVMSGDEILMEPASALGPIDAQLRWQGKVFSAEAFLKGLDVIKSEVEQTGVLNKAYIPMLQNLSPGEIQHAQNALDFAKKLVGEWLRVYKFRTWVTHSSTGQPVTPAERAQRAAEIADELCNHSKWLSHARSIKIPDLEAMRLKITDYSKSPELFDAIRRYHILLQMTFDSAVYKLFETTVSQVYRYKATDSGAPKPAGGRVIGEVKCGKCDHVTKVQLNLGPNVPLEQDCVPYPANDLFTCPKCGEQHNLVELRRQVEMQFKKGVIGQ